MLRARKRRLDRAPAKETLSARHWLLVAFLLVAIALGGSSVAGSTTLLWALSGIIALALLVRWRWAGRVNFDPQLLLITLLLIATFLIQLIPLPPEVWGQLPGRKAFYEDYGLLGMEPPWLPISLDPMSTRDTLLAQLPILCTVLICGGLGRFAPRAVGIAVIGAGAISLLLGIAQAQGGRQEALFLYAPNFGTAMGFFANPNHLATLILICVPISAALLRDASNRSLRLSGFRYPAFAGVVALSLAALVLTRSVAGILLLLPVTAASFILLGAPRKWLLLGAGASSILLGAWMLSPNWEEFVSSNTSFGTAELDRGGIALRSVEIVKATLPIGTGLGTFREIYKVYEDPMTVGPKWVNRAHNEYLELMVEAGLIGVLLVMLIWLWWIVRSYNVWRRDAEEVPWGRAASIVVGIVLFHSFVDYPARMPAIAVILAYFVLLLSAMARQAKGEALPGARR